MAQQARGGARTVTRSYRTDIGVSWWGALLAVTVILGFIGRGDGGFWAAFLWSIVGFVLGSLIAIAISGRMVSARTEAEAIAELDDTAGSGGAR